MRGDPWRLKLREANAHEGCDDVSTLGNGQRLTVDPGRARALSLGYPGTTEP